jgi:hypothetical protein
MGGSWREDLRLAFRQLRRAPAATAASVFALACGIGGAAATWSVLSSVLLNPLPVADPASLFFVEAQRQDIEGNVSASTAQLYAVFQAVRGSDVFEGLAAGGSEGLLVTEGDAIPRERTVYFASHDYFRTLGVKVAGRAFESSDDSPGAPTVAVISDRYWRSVFAGAPDAIGRTVLVGEPRRIATIVGIAPRRFRGLDLTEAPDLYLPLHSAGDVGREGVNYFYRPVEEGIESPRAWIRIVGRLRDGMSARDAAARLDALDVAPVRRRSFRLIDVNTAAIPEITRIGARGDDERRSQA